MGKWGHRMDVLGWIWWTIWSLIGLVWSAVWFLLGGWVATLAQIAVIVLIIFGYKYGWRQAPQEVLSRLGMLGRFGWAWVRAKDASTVRPAIPDRPDARSVRRRGRSGRRQPGDIRINVSTCLSLLMLAGLWLLTAL